MTEPKARRLTRQQRERLLRLGKQLAATYCHGNARLDEAAQVWALLCHATRVSAAAFAPPPRTGYPVASPGAMLTADDVSDWQKMAAYLRGELDAMERIAARPPAPSAEEIDAADLVLGVFHAVALRDFGDWRRMRGAVYAQACRVPPRKIMALTGLSRDRLRHARERAVGDMVRVIVG